MLGSDLHQEMMSEDEKEYEKDYVFRVDFQTGNHAFSECPEYEVSRILRKIADDVSRMGSPGDFEGRIRDINGNTIGHYEWVEEE